MEREARGGGVGGGVGFIKATAYVFILLSRDKQQRNFKITVPGNIRVSSEHVRTISDDCNGVSFPIAPAVKGTGCPTVYGGAVTQNPLWVISNGRHKEHS